MTELKPCPFCGSDAIFSDGYNHWYVRCSNQECLVRTRRFLDKSKAKDCWNRRAKVVPMDCDKDRICPKCGKVMILCEDEKTYYQIWECDGCGYKEVE